MLPEYGSRPSIKDRLKRLAKPFTLPPQPSREELLKGIGTLEDPLAYRALNHAVHDISVSGWQIFMREPIEGEQTGREFLDKINARLGTLAEQGFLNRTDSDMGPDLDYYSPTVKGLRVLRSLRRI